MADSWLIDGNCNKCRRKKYCSSPCTKASRRRKNQLYNDVMEATGIGDILDKAGSRDRFDEHMKSIGYLS